MPTTSERMLEMILIADQSYPKQSNENTTTSRMSPEIWDTFIQVDIGQTHGDYYAAQREDGSLIEGTYLLRGKRNTDEELYGDTEPLRYWVFHSTATPKPIKIEG